MLGPSWPKVPTDHREAPGPSKWGLSCSGLSTLLLVGSVKRTELQLLYLAMWRDFQHSLSCHHFLRQVLRLMHVIAFPAPALPWTQGFVCCYLQYVKQLDRTWFCCICICFYELAYTYAFGLATSSQTTLNSWWANTVCIARPAQGRTSCGWTAPPQRKPPGNSLWKPLGFP